MDYKNYTYRDCLYTIIQYQQELIKRYEEYIENSICKPIEKRTQEGFSPYPLDRVQCQRITIPQVDIMMRCDSWLIHEFNAIKAEFPVFPLHLIEQFVEEKLNK